MINQLEKYFNLLIQSFEYDISIYSQGWLWSWYFLLIPVALYTLIFIIKWIILWLPILIPLGLLTRISIIKIEIKKENKKG